MLADPGDLSLGVDPLCLCVLLDGVCLGLEQDRQRVAQLPCHPHWLAPLRRQGRPW
jgi:hypothetical protein